MRLVRATLAAARRRMRPLRRRLLRPLLRHVLAQPGHLVRVLARLRTRAKTRRQDKTETELQ